MCIRQALNDEVKIGYNGFHNLLDSSLSPRKWERSVSVLVTSPINTPIHNLTLQAVFRLRVALASPPPLFPLVIIVRKPEKVSKCPRE